MVTLTISGETNDQIIVHWPEKDVLFPADNLYRAFPNLYAIRGTASRYFFSIITLILILLIWRAWSLKIRNKSRCLVFKSGNVCVGRGVEGGGG